MHFDEIDLLYNPFLDLIGFITFQQDTQTNNNDT